MAGYLAAVPCRDDEKMLLGMMERHGTAVKRFCHCLLNDAFLAEDAAQEVFFKAWKGLSSFRGECAEKTWLFRIAVNTCNSMHRGFWARHVERKITLEELPLTIDTPVFRDSAVWDAIQALPTDLKCAVILYYYEELPLKDAAQIMKIGVNTPNTRLRRARKLLQNQLKGWYFDE